MANDLAVLWTGRATIYEYQDITDPETFQTKHELVPVVVDEPCRLSYNREQATNIQKGAAVVSQSITVLVNQPCIPITKKSHWNFMRTKPNEIAMGF